MRLNDYFHKHIFDPLGLKSTTMTPTKEMKARLAHLNWKLPDGTVIPRDHPMRRYLLPETKEEADKLFQSGGAGCFSTAREYCSECFPLTGIQRLRAKKFPEILAVLLNNGTCPTTKTQLLSPSTVDTMFTNQIPSIPKFGFQGIPPAKPELTNQIPFLYALYEPEPQQGWGLTFMINGGPSGRSTGTAHWAGLANCFWWCDREKGVAGMHCVQVFPFCDIDVITLRDQVEAGVYKGLGKSHDADGGGK
jgi:CubicO group peptidase (beta-lactamase class C family)